VTLTVSSVLLVSSISISVLAAGTAIANTIHGGNFNDTLNGLAGGDTLYGHGGKDSLNGGSGNDTLTGGDGKDNLTGGTGKDVLDGGKGADVFVYAGASDSTGTAHDIVKHANFAADRFDVPVAVSGIDSLVAGGTLTKAHFDSNLAAAADAAHLGAHHAVLFTPDSGNLSGKTFLIVDQNGVAGYQSGGDLVIDITGAINLGSLGTGDFI